MVCVMTGGVFSKTEMSEVLTEVVRMDPTFDKEDFIKLCRFDVIPNILEVIEYLYVALNSLIVVGSNWLPINHVTHVVIVYDWELSLAPTKHVNY